MILRFFARSGSLVPDPRRPQLTGVQPVFVGRELVISEGAPVQHVADPNGTEIDTETTDPSHLEQFRRALMHGDLWGDEKACAFCSIAHTPLVFDAQAKRFDPAPVMVETKPVVTEKPKTKPEKTGGDS